MRLCGCESCQEHPATGVWIRPDPEFFNLAAQLYGCGGWLGRNRR